jgi:orotidine-5'-phosphate decarboxylase
VRAVRYGPPAGTRNFADRLTDAVLAKGNPVVVGLDPRVDQMPAFVEAERPIASFHEHVVAAVAPLVPAVKLQVAFYEAHGLAGMRAFAETIATAREAGLIVIGDVKRNDVDSTARAYADAYLGRVPELDCDAITVSPYLGRDSLEPFVEACADRGRGLFVLVKTSNPGSGDIQDERTGDGRTVAERVAGLVDELGAPLVGEHGYSAIGAVVGATYPEQAVALRARMPRALVLVPGYGAQGGTGADAAASFGADGLGAVVNASRSITYAYGDRDVTAAAFAERIRANVTRMADDLTGALESR